jgi:iron complex outermembrane recepter protein
MFKLTQMSAGLAAAFGSSLLLIGAPANAQQQQQPQQSPQRIEITGSNIKRLDLETVAPVQIITREQIERTGQPTVAEVLRNIPANTGGSFGESFSNSFAPGAAGISLRGLGQKTTLVLLDGRRVAGYGFAQNLQDTFVDLNSIPSSAVEKIEILKDGASAIYGSDAIAGVVNIILRKNMRGIEANASAGRFEGKGDTRLSFAGGVGDLASDAFNVMGVIDFYKRDYLSQADVKFTKSRDFRSYAGGRNFLSLTGGGTWRQLSATNALTNTFRAISECPGTTLTGTQAVNAGLINVTPVFPVGVPGGLTAATLATNTAQAAATNTFCARDFNTQFTALPGTERLGGIVKGTFELSPEVTARAELALSRVDTFQAFQSTFFAGTTGLTTTPAGLRPYTYNINFAPGVAGNPLTSNARYVGVLNDLGTRDNEIRSDTVRSVLGANWRLRDWDLDSALVYADNRVQSDNLNRLELIGTSAVFGVPTTPQPPVPTSTASTYNLDRWSTNTAQARDLMQIDFPRESKSTLLSLDTRASTTIGRMDGGPIGLGLGLEFRKETLNDKPDPVAAEGGVLGQGITATKGSRNNTAVSAELSMPFTKSVEVQAAIRNDRYTDFGNSLVPKLGVKWNASDILAIRANWGRGFRAPTLPEVSESVATFFTSVIDPEDGVSRQISGVFAGNPSLKAETSASRTIGFILSPAKDVRFGVDLYHLDWRNVVASPAFQDILDASCPTETSPCPSTSNVVRDPTTNFVVTILSNYQNLAQRVTEGGDLEFEFGVPTNFGKFKLRGDVTYVKSFKEDGIEYAGTNGGTNTIPRVRGSLALDYDAGGWSLTGRYNYTGGYRQDALGASWFAVQDPRFQNGVYPTKVAAYGTVDLYGSYAISKNFKISGSVLNVGDKTPPYDPGFSTTSLYDFSLHDVRGRQVRFSLNYKM